MSSEPLEMPLDPPELDVFSDETGPEEEVRKGHKGLRAPRNNNALVEARIRSDQRWWEKNDTLIGYLDEGRPVREIATLVEEGERQIRIVKDKLKDFREAEGVLS